MVLYTDCPILSTNLLVPLYHLKTSKMAFRCLLWVTLEKRVSFFAQGKQKEITADRFSTVIPLFMINPQNSYVSPSQ